MENVFLPELNGNFLVIGRVEELGLEVSFKNENATLKRLKGALLTYCKIQ